MAGLQNEPIHALIVLGFELGFFAKRLIKLIPANGFLAIVDPDPILFFTAFDPTILSLSGGFGEISRLGGYSIGFFLFWLLTSVTCALTCYFQRPCQNL